MSNYFPFGFVYPDGFSYSETNPDPAIEAIKKRIDFLNSCHDTARMPDGTQMPGHIFAAAMDLFQKESSLDVDRFWYEAQIALTPSEIGTIATALAPKVQDALPLLDFPNAIALFDCRFISVSEWEHIRRYSIGGSEAATVLGLAHYQSRRSLYYEKKSPSLLGHDASTRQIFDYGHCIEDYTVNAIAHSLGARRYPEYRMFAHKKYPFITCNPDAILFFPDGSLALFEAKTATRWKLDDWKQEIPEYYVPQPRQYLAVLNDPRLCGGYIGCCFGALPCDIKCHTFTRDLAAEQLQIEQIVSYWYDHIVPGVVPGFAGNPELDLEAAYKYRNMGVLASVDALDASRISDFKRYFDLQSDLKALNDEIRTAKSVEDALMAEIRPCVADGLTVCSIPDHVPYKIKMSAYTTESVDPASLPHNIREWLLLRSSALRDRDYSYTTPKVSKAVKKAPVNKRKKA